MTRWPAMALAMIGVVLVAWFGALYGGDTDAGARLMFDRDAHARSEAFGRSLSAAERAELEPGGVHGVSHTAVSVPPRFSLASWLAGAGSRSDPIPVQRWSMRAEHASVEALYVPGRTGRLVVFLPELAGDGSAGALVLRHAISRGDGALVLTPPVNPPGGAFPGLAHALLVRVRESRLALRVVREQIAPDCLALVGLSAGALVAPAVAALEPAPDALVLMLGGGDLLAIAAEGELPWLAQPDLPGDAITGADPHTRLALAAVDPLRHAPALRGEGTLLVEAFFDRVVPRASRAALAHAIPAAERVAVPTGHFSFGIALPFVLDQIEAFLDRECARVEATTRIADHRHGSAQTPELRAKQ